MSKLLFCALFLSFASVSLHAGIDTSKPVDLKFTAVDGSKVDISKLRGKVVLIDFWATWCPPCRVIAPDLVGIYKKYHKQGLEIVGISVDSDKAAMLAFVKKEGSPWPQYFEEKNANNEIADQFEVEQFPTILVVDRKGMIVNRNLGELWFGGFGFDRVTSDATLKKIDDQLEKYLKAP